MAKVDEEKTTFITSQGVFCYSKMPFGLKNARATYQRLVDKAFQKQIGRNLEVYVDDLVIKSRTEHEIIRDMEETFKTLREINMKLNPKKCTFGIEEGTFLGYKVNTEGIMVCPDKVGAVLNLPSPKCLKDVQKLNGKLASLNRFLSKSAEKSLSFFKTLKKCTKKSDFQWTAEAEAAFKEMKKLIAKLPTLTSPMEKEELIVYLAAAREAISAVLMTKREAKQMSVYFASCALQVLADFIDGKSGRWTLRLRPMASGGWKHLDHGVCFTDGSSCIDGFGAGLILTNPKRAEFTYALRFRFDTTNNEVLVEELKKKVLNEVEVLAQLWREEGRQWLTQSIITFMGRNTPRKKKRQRAVSRDYTRNHYLRPHACEQDPLVAKKAYGQDTTGQTMQRCQENDKACLDWIDAKPLLLTIIEAIQRHPFKRLVRKVMHPPVLCSVSIHKANGLVEEQTDVRRRNKGYDGLKGAKVGLKNFTCLSGRTAPDSS
ncbi:reverse transcriptase domain-containing protein [Tanacetum coccineum]